MKLLFELFLEELPASEMTGLDKRVKDTLSSILDNEGVSHNDFAVYITPRRIAVKLEFEEYIEAKEKEIVGPPESVCFKDNKPTKALLGFLKKNGATTDDIRIKQTKKGRYVSVVLKGEHREAKPVVKEAVKLFLHRLHFNKKMRWGEGKFEFIRPVHNMTFTIDNKTEEFEFASVNANSYTYGHRFLNKGKIELTYEDYEKELEKGFVIVNQNERRDVILNQLNSLCKEYGVDVVYDEELLDEVVNLTEYPKVVVGEFEERFLKLPKEVLIISMKDHQRYFAFMKNGNLSNKFAAVSNIVTENMDIIKQGYERVLRARFSDAEFFFDEDSKHKLEEFVEPLKKMMFQEKLGSQYERTQRLESLSEFIANLLGFDANKAKRAAHLSKADLLTQMVYEFPELQGVMGREYAIISKEDKEVASAIYEQYLPKDDEIPHTQAGISLSLADKFDLIVGGFIANLKPTGTKDPYALRRAALGIIRTLIENKIELNLNDVIDKALQLYDKNANKEEIIEFIKVRFVNYLNKYPYDALEAVVSSKFNDVYDAYLRLTAIKNLFDNDKDKQKRFAIKRVFNIVKDFDKTDVDTGIFTQDEEKRLFEKISSLEKSSKLQIENKNYTKLLNDIVAVKDTINMFFDNVMVMDKDEKIKINRLSLLNRLRNIVLNVADFRFLEI